ncbi:MAG: divalent-cation tolerance protein CutA [Burkholderiales bacterium]|nr:divalent-cation tolerance protein CutA [Burkholderiales bacterium]
MKLLAVTTTTATQDEALRIARHLVEQGLAACVQLEPIDSVYRWDGVLQQGPEVRLVAKTTETRYPAVEAAIRALHPYELPDIHAVVLDRVFEPYAQWVAQAVDPQAPDPTQHPG